MERAGVGPRPLSRTAGQWSYPVLVSLAHIGFVPEPSSQLNSSFEDLNDDGQTANYWLVLSRGCIKGTGHRGERKHHLVSFREHLTGTEVRALTS